MPPRLAYSLVYGAPYIGVSTFYPYTTTVVAGIHATEEEVVHLATVFPHVIYSKVLEGLSLSDLDDFM